MSASSTTELYHSVPSTANAVGASALFVALNTFQFVARKSLLVSPAGAAYKFVVSEVLKPISAKCPLVSAILKSPPFGANYNSIATVNTCTYICKSCCVNSTCNNVCVCSRTSCCTSYCNCTSKCCTAYN